jgi:glutamate synthase (NADPH/NADH) large chain
VNAETVLLTRLESRFWEQVLQEMIAEHGRQTGSPLAAEILRNWETERGTFWQVCPREMVSRLTHPLSDSPAKATA